MVIFIYERRGCSRKFKELQGRVQFQAQARGGQGQGEAWDANAKDDALCLPCGRTPGIYSPYL